MVFGISHSFLKINLHQMGSTIKCPLSSKIIFHQKVIFQIRLSFVVGPLLCYSVQHDFDSKLLIIVPILLSTVDNSLQASYDWQTDGLTNSKSSTYLEMPISPKIRRGRIKYRKQWTRLSHIGWIMLN